MRGDKKIKNRGFLYSAKQVLLGVFDASIILLGMLIIFLAFFYTKTPAVGDLEKREIVQSSVIYDRSGTKALYEIFGEENRKVLKHDEIPNTLRAVTIAAEDDSFYSHMGIDLKSILRAAKVNLESGEIKQGASTITQQLARSIYLTNERIWERKIKEMFLAFQIEKKYSKTQILDMYLNQIPYGSNAYGVEKAAQTFFGKNAIDLTLDEAAFLAALPKATTHYSPYGENRDELAARHKQVIMRVGELELASEEVVAEALKEDTFSKIVPLKRHIAAPHFVFYIMEKLEKRYDRKFLEQSGWKIITTLDWEAQQRAEEILRKGVEEDAAKYGASNGAMVVIDPKTGEVLAMVGSRDYFDDDNDGQVNVALSLRQPGSAFKPIIYARSFEEGYQPETLLKDEQTNFGPDGGGRSYVPRNYSGTFRGVVSIRDALGMSLNIPAVKALRYVGIDDAIELAERMGISTLTDRENYGLSLALGGGAINLLEITSAFSVFANDGVRNPPASVLEIIEPNGETGYEFELKENRVIDAQIARKINSILSDNKARTPVFGPSSPLFLPSVQVAAKTGTNQEYRDGWTIGYTPDLAVGVWVGNNDNSPMNYGAAGTFVAAPIWNRFMASSSKNFSGSRFADYNRMDEMKAMVLGEVTSKELEKIKEEEKERAEEEAKKARKEEKKKKKKKKK